MREWSADWHAYKWALAERDLYGEPEWLPCSEESDAGWGHKGFGGVATVLVKPIEVGL
ncbi:hypothetical protein [Streptomyces venezuelae]|nr:hypothetical protein [Streptomyces venezuelae]